MRAVVDRIENAWAVILVGENETKLFWPIDELPDNINEGDLLQLNARIDEEKTKESRKEVKNLIDKLKK